MLARFIPVVRTFLNPVAGILEMPARKFFIWNVIGAVIWTDGILLAGNRLAKQITDIVPADKIDRYLVPIIVADRAHLGRTDDDRHAAQAASAQAAPAQRSPTPTRLRHPRPGTPNDATMVLNTPGAPGSRTAVRIAGRNPCPRVERQIGERRTADSGTALPDPTAAHASSEPPASA